MNKRRRRGLGRQGPLVCFLVAVVVELRGIIASYRVFP